jgi:hypothetical protein
MTTTTITARTILGVVAAMIILVAGILALTFWNFGAFESTEIEQLQFESNAWKQANPIGHRRTIRSQMVDDLISRQLLNEMDRAQVEALLGPSIDYSQLFGKDESRWDVVYEIGLERQGRWSFDTEFLAIRFDRNGNVLAYKTIRK